MRWGGVEWHGVGWGGVLWVRVEWGGLGEAAWGGAGVISVHPASELPDLLTLTLIKGLSLYCPYP